MKNFFAHLTLATVLGLPTLLAAETFGLMPSLPLSVEMLVGGYVAGGLLALAAHDYGRGPARHRPPVRTSSRPQPAAKPTRHHPAVGWAHHTISA